MHVLWKLEIVSGQKLVFQYSLFSVHLSSYEKLKVAVDIFFKLATLQQKQRSLMKPLEASLVSNSLSSKLFLTSINIGTGKKKKRLRSIIQQLDICKVGGSFEK